LPGTDLSGASRGSGRVSVRAGARTEGRARGQARSSLRRLVSRDRAGLAARREGGCLRDHCRSRTDASGNLGAEGGRPRRGEPAREGVRRAASRWRRRLQRLSPRGGQLSRSLPSRVPAATCRREEARAALRAAVASCRRHASLPPASRSAALSMSSAAAASETSSACRNASPSSHRRRARRYPRSRCYCGCRIQSESGLREAPSLRVREVAREVFTWLTES
jgi:hypothetical protein